MNYEGFPLTKEGTSPPVNLEGTMIYKNEKYNIMENTTMKLQQ